MNTELIMKRLQEISLLSNDYAKWNLMSKNPKFQYHMMEKLEPWMTERFIAVELFCQHIVSKVENYDLTLEFPSEDMIGYHLKGFSTCPMGGAKAILSYQENEKPKVVLILPYNWEAEREKARKILDGCPFPSEIVFINK
jgi:hypothetical protein